MNRIAITAQTMSSREIAVLTGKEHKHVMRDIRAMLVELGLNEAGYVHIWTEPQNGQEYPEFRLDRELTDTLLTGYSVIVRRKVIARWHDLEAAAAGPVVLSRMDILHLAIDSEQRAIAAEKLASDSAILIEQQKPAVEFVDRYVASTGNKGFREVCKLLKANGREFGAWLDRDGITYRLAGERTAHQRHVDAGRFVTKAGTTGDGGHSFNQLKFTPKGVAWVAGEWAKHQIKEVAAC